MDSRGHPLTIAKVRYLAECLLRANLKPFESPESSELAFISERWVRRFINRHEAEIKSKYSKRYDYQRAKCEDPKLIMQSRESNARAIQPGNREWVTSIVTISAAGYVLPPQIIFAGKLHQEKWFEAIPNDWRVSVSENGWTTDKLGFEWLQFFDEYTASKTIGQYRLLILDGHGSHSTIEFDQFCKKQASFLSTCLRVHFINFNLLM
ncbi:uncharacterized protein KD926_002508 [Aspergillus affinis]|uniref:uncharacterized protein n=1 Tax=Aspergillus affinis TaxID=1070780 RepID=UPI0022FDDDBF|nr:uncharacterized protein KD926_002508 [Aspergillus affinis]KAI9036029.1 hypothetical protein KD926_002508 [Aspergillus affinis]